MIHGIGIDIIEISRVEKAMNRWGRRFLDHVFTEEEICYAGGHARPAQHFAARFAAKEAVFKALGDERQLGWKDIMISHDPSGKPICAVRLEGFNKKIHLTLSHGKDYAVANALVTA
jgi:holo-[acyl-carrier protein] synthase